MSSRKNNLHRNIKQSDHVQSLEKGLKVIQVFSEDHPRLTVSQASKETGINRPTVRRIMLTLESLGFATSQNGHFSLTAKALTLGYAYLSSQNVWNLSYPKMQALVKKIGESCSISVLDRTHIIYVARVPAKRIMSINIDVGTRLPAYATSMGRVLLSGLDDNILREYINEIIFEPITNQTVIDQQKFLTIIDHTRNQGFAHVENQLEQGLRSLAVPLKNQNGEMVAAINCSVHAGRVSENELLKDFLPLLRKTAEDISSDIKTHKM
ncbi:helix-turn-helix domain-containing protein [Salicibibacter cibarius]|uniref:Helix-turn-helix domain-containing protein n=1 Tax=Salicibibacter cibarius TaxID=2743000 RepID=A0A7T6Z018_9BACI|nr:IclR family transcriptional regulator C-terminal domain-containing protein [Salicibibacter cibarius]QQK74394.1 helix-turn-helix domain-containing protein [Salicibibacter cibarius]